MPETLSPQAIAWQWSANSGDVASTLHPCIMLRMSTLVPTCVSLACVQNIAPNSPVVEREHPSPDKVEVQLRIRCEACGVEYVAPGTRGYEEETLPKARLSRRTMARDKRRKLLRQQCRVAESKSTDASLSVSASRTAAIILLSQQHGHSCVNAFIDGKMQQMCLVHYASRPAP